MMVPNLIVIIISLSQKPPMYTHCTIIGRILEQLWTYRERPDLPLPRGGTLPTGMCECGLNLHPPLSNIIPTPSGVFASVILPSLSFRE